VVGGVVVVVLGILLIAGFLVTRRSDSTVDTASGTSTTSRASVSTSVAPGTTATLVPGVPVGQSITGATPCPPADGSATRTTSFAEAPPMCIDPTKTYLAKVSTTKGDFTIALDPKQAPLATNNFVVLSRYHFYDGVPFHRVIPGFVVQGGDATGNPAGTGNPGYKFKDELPSDPSAYKTGTVAMANSGPDTNGSQFYIVVAEGKLGAQYTIFGQVVEGYDTTVKAIEAGGSAGGTPTDPAAIKSVTIVES
jgi:cyclophilin family peptidyl-prolyl cis-trans isomerase